MAVFMNNQVSFLSFDILTLEIFWTCQPDTAQIKSKKAKNKTLTLVESKYVP